MHGTRREADWAGVWVQVSACGEVGCLQEVEAGLGRVRPHPIGMVSTRTHALICRYLTVTVRYQFNVREGRLRNARRNQQGLADRLISRQRLIQEQPVGWCTAASGSAAR